MARRGPLRSHLIQAWGSALQKYYDKRLINSERGLQFYFCQDLLTLLSSDSRRLFIEPTFTRKNSVKGTADRVTPDVVICNTRQIIGVVELKYTPRQKANYAKDLETLSWFDQQTTELSLENERYLGINDGPLKSYTVANDAVLCWAGVYKGAEPQQVDEGVLVNSLAKDRFLALHAVTAQGGDIYVSPRPRS